MQYYLYATVFLRNTEPHSLKHRSTGIDPSYRKAILSHRNTTIQGNRSLADYSNKVFRGHFRCECFFSHDFEKTLTLNNYCSIYGMDDTVKITKYAIIDLDQDNIPEIVLGITENKQSDCDFLVLRFQNGSVVGYDLTYRQMIDLKKDGAFGYLGGVADTGYARLNFTDNSWEYIKICYVTETANTVMFFCNGQEVSEEAY